MNILTKRIIVAAGMIIHTKNIIAAMDMIILMNITNMSILTRTVTAAADTTIPTRTNILTSIIMNTANAAVTKRSIRRTTMQATKIFCTTKKICPTS